LAKIGVVVFEIIGDLTGIVKNIKKTEAETGRLNEPTTDCTNDYHHKFTQHWTS